MCCAAFYDHINTGAAAALIFAGADITATDNTGYSPHCFGSVQPAGANGGGARRLTAEDMARISPQYTEADPTVRRRRWLTAEDMTRRSLQYTEAVRKVSRVQRSIACRRWSSACHLRRTRSADVHADW
jgi:hypothetical protein